MLKDERRFDFIPQKKWKSLSKEDMSHLQSYKSYYGHYKRTLKKVDELKAKLKAEEEKVKNYVTKLYKINKSIDHLRSDYHFSFTIYKVKSRNYYGLTINRRGHNPKNGTLGSPKLIENHLREYYKRRPLKMAELDRIGWDRFIRNEVNDRSGKSEVRDVIVDAITKDVSLKSFSLNRKTLFPISSLF